MLAVMCERGIELRGALREVIGEKVLQTASRLADILWELGEGKMSLSVLKTLRNFMRDRKTRELLGVRI